MVASRIAAGLTGAVAAFSLLAVAPGAAASPKPAKKRSALSLPMPGGIGSFTPAAADPKRAAQLSMSGFGSGGFRFTPSVAPGSRRDVTVAVRARAATPAAAQRSAAVTSPAVPALAPTAYNLGVAVGWKRFAISGDIMKTEGSLLPIDRESVDVGLSYSGNAWSTHLQLGADRSVGDGPSLIGADTSYSVDLGGSYALTGNLEVTGGVRYKRDLNRLNYVADARRDSQAVYIGTAFRF